MYIHMNHRVMFLLTVIGGNNNNGDRWECPWENIQGKYKYTTISDGTEAFFFCFCAQYSSHDRNASEWDGFWHNLETIWTFRWWWRWRWIAHDEWWPATLVVGMQKIMEWSWMWKRKGNNTCMENVDCCSLLLTLVNYTRVAKKEMIDTLQK